MILTCPNCDTRYSVDGAKFPAAGRTVRCAKCGHSWHQPGEQPEAEAMAAQEAAAEPVETPASQASEEDAMAGGYAVNPSATRSFAPRSAVAEERQPLGPRIAVVAGWAGLIAVVLLIAWSAIKYRQDIAVIWPQSAGVYSSLGMAVNPGGITFQHVDYRRESEDGQIVLAVTGMIVNAGTREMPVQQNVRVTLSDASNHELYHWSFKPSATTLKPGQQIPFTTRLSSPPAAARHLEVRFAKDGP